MNKEAVNTGYPNTELTSTPPFSLKPQEESYILALRKQQEKRAECAKEIDAVLTKYGARLSLDPNSSFGKPEITVIFP